MGLLDWISARREQKAASIWEVIRSVYGSRESKSGRVVNWDTSLEVSTVLACARVIADGLAQVPLCLMQETGEGGATERRVEATDHPLYDVLHRRPNSWQTSYEFRESMGLHLVLTGNAFAMINRVRGRVVELLPFEPQAVSVTRNPDYSLAYKLTAPSGQSQDLPAQAMWHVRGPSWNTWMGLEAVRYAREAIGLAMATEEAHARMHANGSRPGGVYSVDGTLSDDQYKKLADWIKANFEGVENSHKTMILDRGAKWQPMGLSGIDAQHLETRRFQIEEICRHFRVMPIMVGYSDKAATYASAEQMFLAHVVHTLSPWYERIEQSIDVNLLTPAERAQGYYANFEEEELVRGSIEATANYLVTLSTNGIMTRNEARARLDLNPIDGLDEPLTPSNLTVGAKPPPPPAPTPAPAPPKFDINVTSPPVNVNFEEGAIKADVHTTVERQGPDAIEVNAPDVKVDAPVTIGDTHLTTSHEVVVPGKATRQTIKRDANGDMTEITTEPIDG